MQPVLEFWDRSKELSLNNREYKEFVVNFFESKLKNDKADNDVTTNALFQEDKEVTAVIAAKQDGILAGIEEAIFFLNDFNPNVKKNDGELIKKGGVIIEIKGSLKKLLAMERTILNILQRMSGIATLTFNLNKKINGKSKIAATRKTLWGLLDKKAVSVGKGLTHRLNLADSILIKDNHLNSLNNNILLALEKANDSNSKYIEIEVGSKKNVIEVALKIKSLKSKKLFAIMLDNFQVDEIKDTIKELKDKKLYDSVLIEVSGGINEGSIEEYSIDGVNIISLGFLTHSAKALDISMEIK